MEKTKLSDKILRGELIRLYKDKFISDYKNKIEWVYDEEKAHRPRYRINNYYGKF